MTKQDSQAAFYRWFSNRFHRGYECDSPDQSDHDFLAAFQAALAYATAQQTEQMLAFITFTRQNGLDLLATPSELLAAFNAQEQGR
ncbi:MAG TPA: hypothetical protein VND94_00645 [Terriglobia bacterium]|nr:hypothetical protein [Terriglobia bacterium]